MRFTEYHCGKAVIKNKEFLAEAIKKLARYEDMEDYIAEKNMEDILGTAPISRTDIEGNQCKICPNCSAIVEDGEWRAYYCPDCGEKIRWRKENE